MNHIRKGRLIVEHDSENRSRCVLFLIYKPIPRVFYISISSSSTPAFPLCNLLSERVMKWPILPIYFSLLTACSALEQPKLLPKPINVCNYHPTFGLTNIYTYSYLIYSTPAHLAVSQGFINFTFSDSASQSPGLCQGSSNTPFDFFRGDRDYPCLQAAPDTSSFRYISGGDFKINSTWTCVEPWQNTT